MTPTLKEAAKAVLEGPCGYVTEFVSKTNKHQRYVKVRQDDFDVLATAVMEDDELEGQAVLAEETRRERPR